MNPVSPESLEARLLEQGLPPGYVRRLLDEWESHLVSLSTERPRGGGEPPDECPAGRRADWERLGPAPALIDAALSQYRSTRWAGRHPLLAFVLAPALLVCAGWGLLAALIVDLISHGTRGSAPARLAAALAAHDSAGDRLQVVGGLAVCLLVILITRLLHARSGRPGRWFHLGLAATGSVALLLCIRLVPPLGDSPGRLVVRLRPPDSSAQLLGGLLPWLCVLWCATRDRLMPSPPTRRAP